LAAAAEVLAALVAQVVPEARLPVPEEPLVPRPLPCKPEFPALAPPLLAQLPVLAHLVVDSELLPDLLSRQSFSAAMARSSP
jgi:hypothetical protein